MYKGLALYNLGDYDNAIIQFLKSTELDPNYATAWLWTGNCHASAKKYKEAIEAYKKVLEIDPNNQDAADQIKKVDSLMNNKPEGK